MGIAPPEAPLVVQIADQFRDALNAAESVQRIILAERWIDVERALEERIEALVESVAEDSGLTESQVYQLARWRELIRQVNREINRFIEIVTPEIDDLAAAQVRNGARNAAALTQASAREVGASIRVSLMQLNAAAVENVVALARAGQPLADLMTLAYGEAADGMVSELINGIALGQGPRETARRMAQDGLSRGFNHIELVARDQHNRSYRMASQQQYQHSNVVESYTRRAARNERTCRACLALDGTVHPVDDFMALHPQDRCVMVPNIRGFAPIEFEGTEAWFRRQDRDVQMRILGPGGLQAYEDGLFDWTDMATIKPNEIWGPSAGVTPLKELVKN